MAVKNINDLTGPVGMTTSETTNQDEERMDYFTTPLVTATDFDPAFNEPGALDYADRFDFDKKTSKPSLATRAIKGIISAVNPLKKGKILMNLAMSSPDFAKNVIKKGNVVDKAKQIDDILNEIGEEKLKTFTTQTELIRFIKKEYNVDVAKSPISRRIKSGILNIGKQDSNVDEKFLELFKDKTNAVDKIGTVKASASLNELLNLDETFVLGAKNSELIKLLENKGIKLNADQISRLRVLYKTYKGIDLTGKRGVSQFINLDDPKISDILQDVILGNIPKYKAAKMLEELFPNSGFTTKYAPNQTTGYFSKFYQSYIDNLDDDVLKLLSTSKEGSPKSFFNELNIGDKVTPKASGYLKFTTIFDNTKKTFTQTRRSFLNNDISKTLVNKTKNLFQDKSIKLFDVDHIQAPRFGGTNAESNLRLITKADHTTLKTLPTNKTLATDVVKAKSGFENEYYNLSTKLIDNIKNNNYVAADKIAESLRVMVNNFKNTYKNVDFVVGTPHVAIKTGDNTAKYIKYGDDVKLSTKQKNYIENNNLLPEQSNLPNAGKSIEKQAEDIYQGYLQIYNLIGEIPSGSIGKVAGDIKSMDVPRPRDITVRKDFSGMRNGGLVGISHLTRPL
jgi:arginine repressor